jgi:hypothetical protein
MILFTLNLIALLAIQARAFCYLDSGIQLNNTKAEAVKKYQKETSISYKLPNLLEE